MEQRDIIRSILELSIQKQGKDKSRSRSLPVNSSNKGSLETVSSRSIGRQSSWLNEDSPLEPSLPSRSMISLPMKPTILMAIPPQCLPDREMSTCNEETSNDGQICNIASLDSVRSGTQGKCINTADCTPTQSARGGSVRTPAESTLDWDVETGKILEIFLMKPMVHDLVDVIQLSWRTHKAQMQQDDVRKQISSNNQEGNPAILDMYQNLYSHEYKAIDNEIAKAGSGASLVSLKRTTSDLWHRDIYFKGVPGLQFALQRTVHCTSQSQYEQHPTYNSARPHSQHPSLPVSEAKLLTSLALHTRIAPGRKSTETAATGANALVPDSTIVQATTARTRDTADGTDAQVPNQPKLKRRTTFGLAKVDMSKLSLANMGKPTFSGAEAGTSQALDEVDYTASGKQTLPPQGLQVARSLRHKAKLSQLVTRNRSLEAGPKTSVLNETEEECAAGEAAAKGSAAAKSGKQALNTGDNNEYIRHKYSFKQARRRTKRSCLSKSSPDSHINGTVDVILACRRLRIKCGEERPTCSNCVKSKRNCEGYNPRVIVKDPLGAYWPSGGAAYESCTYSEPNTAHIDLDAQHRELQSRNVCQTPLPFIAPQPIQHEDQAPTLDFTSSVSFEMDDFPPIEIGLYSDSDLETNPSFIQGPIGGMQHDDHFHEVSGEENELVLDEDDYEKTMEYDYRRGKSYSPPMPKDEGYISSRPPMSYGEPDQDDAGEEAEVDDAEDVPEAREEEEIVEDTMDEAEAERVVRELLGKYTTLFANQGVDLDILKT